MLKFVSIKPDGGKVVGLGLDDRNLERLKDGKPIIVNVKQQLGLDLDVELFIFYGETLDDMIDDLRKAGITLPPPAEWKSPRNPN